MKIAVSNILWPKGQEHLPAFLDGLADQGVIGVELALNCFWEEPVDATTAQIKNLQTEIRSRGLTLVSLHSLTFTRPDLELFGERERLKKLTEYLHRYLELARQLGCANVVFGSPKSRKTYGRSWEDLNRIYLDFLHAIDGATGKVAFNIEPLSAAYCNYLNSFMEGVALLEGGDFNNIFVQLDIRSVVESDEDIEEILQYAEFIRHAHTGNPGFGLPGGEWGDHHRLIAAALRRHGYSGFITAEILNNHGEEPGRYLDRTINTMKELYG